MSKRFDLLVIGEINPDLILAGDNVEPVFGQREKLVEDVSLTIGSSSAIMASGAARLGLRTVIVGVVGEDLFGRFMVEALAEHGVDTSQVVIDGAQHTGFSVILSQGIDRAILTFVGAIDALKAEHIPDELLQETRHVHVGSYFLQTSLQPGLPALFRRAQEWGASTSLDTNWDPSAKWIGLDPVLAHTSLFLPNETEACSIAGEPALPAALATLAERVPLVVVKLGERGAIARRGTEVVRTQALPMAVADTVGAGDSFDAGFIYGYLHGWPLARSLQLATACGSLSTRAQGGTGAQPTLAEALAHIDMERTKE